jgi:protein-tyrosine phosphatase
VRILFVCNANIVRSFMAERVLKRRLKACAIHGVEVSSAGLLDMQGGQADETARQILEEDGIADEGHRSRVLTQAMIVNADLIVAMEKKQLQSIGDQYPDALNKLRLLKSYLPDPGYGETGRDIKDPYRRSMFDYRLCYAEISLAIEELIKCI